MAGGRGEATGVTPAGSAREGHPGAGLAQSTWRKNSLCLESREQEAEAVRAALPVWRSRGSTEEQFTPRGPWGTGLRGPCMIWVNEPHVDARKMLRVSNYICSVNNIIFKNIYLL